MDLRSYPYGRWPRLRRRDVGLLSRCLRSHPMRSPAAALESLGGLVGAPVTIRRGTPWIRADGVQGALGDWPVAAVLEAPEGPAEAVLELDPALALWALERALGAPDARDHAGAGPLSEGERGVLAYLIARVLAAGGAPWRVRTVLGTEAAVRELVGEGPAVIWPAELRFEGAAGWVRAWSTEAALDAAPSGSPPPRRATLRIPVTMVAEAGWARLPLAELRTVRAGDAIVLDEAFCRPGDPTARLRVRAAGARRTHWWCRASAGGLTLESVDRTHAAPTGEGRRMTEGEGTATLIDRTGDAPVEIAVEMARFTLPLEELGAVQPGEVLLTGRVIGERVTLRAGDRVVGTGELVDVEGEVGVRVLEIE